jgi:DNA-binding NarL/FixJ family response regulator
MKKTLLLIDDHPMLCTGFKQFVRSRPELELVGEAPTGAAGLAYVDQLAPDLVILDVHLPDMDGIEVAKAILLRRPEAKIMIFSGDATPQTVQEALKSGVRGFLLKTTGLEELSKAIEAILAGKLFYCSEVSVDLLEDYRKSLTQGKVASLNVLPERELQLLRLICDGHRTKEIAAQMGLSPKSVETYRMRLMNKLSCRSTAELVRYAIREHIIEA